MGNRDALLDGALDCLLEKGYSHTTARDVAGRAATSLAAIGYHFGSTEQLLNAAIAEGFRRWRAQFSLVLEANAGRSGEEQLAAIGDELTRLFRDERSLSAVFLEALALADRSNGEVRAQVAASYEEDRVGVAALVGVVRGGEHGDERLVASMLLALVDGLIIQHAISLTDAPSPRVVLDLVAPILLSGSRGTIRESR